MNDFGNYDRNLIYRGVTYTILPYFLSAKQGTDCNGTCIVNTRIRESTSFPLKSVGTLIGKSLVWNSPYRLIAFCLQPSSVSSKVVVNPSHPQASGKASLSTQQVMMRYTLSKSQHNSRMIAHENHSFRNFPQMNCLSRLFVQILPFAFYILNRLTTHTPLEHLTNLISPARPEARPYCAKPSHAKNTQLYHNFLFTPSW